MPLRLVYLLFFCLIMYFLWKKEIIIFTSKSQIRTKNDIKNNIVRNKEFHYIDVKKENFDKCEYNCNS